MRRLAFLVLLLTLVRPALGQEAGTPGQFDYWVLSLSWSPSWCDSEPGRKDGEQCGARRFGFIVHGLWPQYANGGYPADCPAGQANLPYEVAEKMLPVMPSRKLIAHEWQKHGTCSGLAPAEYFGKARAAFDKVKLPQALKAPEQPVTLTVDELDQLFTAANPGLAPDAMAVMCRGPKAAEVRICMDKDLKFRACGRDLKDRCAGGKATFLSVK